MSIASRFAKIALPLVSAIALAGCATQSQQPSASQSAQAAVPPSHLCPLPDVPPKEIASKPGYVQYVVTVINDEGRPVEGLKQADFRLSANGKALPIAYFRDDKNGMPASIAIVVDTSGSMRSKVPSTGGTKLQTVTDALRAASQNLSACDEVALIVFTSAGPLHPISNSKATVAEAFSTNHEDWINKLDSMTAYGRTPLYDAISLAEHELESAHFPNRAILLITDGVDDSSDLTKDDLLEEVARDDVSIDVVGIGNENGGPTRFWGPLILSMGGLGAVDVPPLLAIASAAQGHFWLVSTTGTDTNDSLAKGVTTFFKTVGHTYSIGVFAPANATPKIEIENAQRVYIHARRESPSAN